MHFTPAGIPAAILFALWKVHRPPTHSTRTRARAGSTDPAKLKAALGKSEYVSVAGSPIRFDERQQATPKLYVAVVKDGKRVIVEEGMVEQKAATTSRGEMDATGTDEASWAKDRRVDIVLGIAYEDEIDKAIAATAIVAWVGVIYWGRMLPFLGNAF